MFQENSNIEFVDIRKLLAVFKLPNLWRGSNILPRVLALHYTDHLKLVGGDSQINSCLFC